MFFRKKTKKQNDKKPEIIQYPIIQGHILCSASEIGKCIVNRCLELGYNINTMKLEKLLVLAYGEYLYKTGKKLFGEKIEFCDHGAMIREVDHDFLRYAIEFDTRFYEWYLLLEAQEKVLHDIVRDYGHMDAFEINDDLILKRLKEYKNQDGFISDEDILKVFEKFHVC